MSCNYEKHTAVSLGCSFCSRVYWLDVGRFVCVLYKAIFTVVLLTKECIMMIRGPSSVTYPHTRQTDRQTGKNLWRPPTPHTG